MKKIFVNFGVRAFQGVQNRVTKNPGILADSKSRDPGIPGIPLGPDHDHGLEYEDLEEESKKDVTSFSYDAHLKPEDESEH